MPTWALAADQGVRPTALDVGALQVVRGRHAVVDRLFQLRRPAGHLLGFPAAQKRIRSRSGAAWAARLVVRVGLWIERSIRGRPRRSFAPQIRNPGWTARLEPHMYGNGVLSQLRHAAFLPRC